MLSGARNPLTDHEALHEPLMNFGPNAPFEEIDMIARYGTAAVIGAAAVIFALFWLALQLDGCVVWVI
jgi:hypothetical protein